MLNYVHKLAANCACHLFGAALIVYSRVFTIEKDTMGVSEINQQSKVTGRVTRQIRNK